MNSLKNLANKNPTIYTGCEIVSREEYSGYPKVVSRVMSIIGVEERSEGGLILHLKDGEEEYNFEFERSHKESGKRVSDGESVRRHFLSDIGALDIFEDWDPHTLDYDNLIGKIIEAFVSKGINNGKGNKKDKIVAISPVLIPVQIKSGADSDIGSIFYKRRADGLKDYNSEGCLN